MLTHRIGRKYWTQYHTTRGTTECIPCIATSPRSVVPGTIHDNKWPGTPDPDLISRVRPWNRHVFVGPGRVLQCHPVFLPVTFYLQKLRYWMTTSGPLPTVLPLVAPLLPIITIVAIVACFSQSFHCRLKLSNVSPSFCSRIPASTSWLKMYDDIGQHHTTWWHIFLLDILWSSSHKTMWDSIA